MPANNNLCGSIHGCGRNVDYAGTRVRRRDAAARPLDGARRRSLRRSAGVERRHRPEGLDAQLREVAELGIDARDRRRTGVQRRHQRSQTPRVRRVHRQAALGIADHLGHSRAAHVVRVDGKQYIAVHSGWGGDPRGMQATLNRLFPGEYPPVPEGGAVWVFALE